MSQRDVFTRSATCSVYYGCFFAEQFEWQSFMLLLYVIETSYNVNPRSEIVHPQLPVSYRGNALGNGYPIGSDENLFILKFYGQLFSLIFFFFFVYPFTSSKSLLT